MCFPIIIRKVNKDRERQSPASETVNLEKEIYTDTQMPISMETEQE